MVQTTELLGFVLCCALVLGALILFVAIQLMLHDPKRRENNDIWFRQFEQQLRSRYNNKELNWRVNALSDLFRRI